MHGQPTSTFDRILRSLLVSRFLTISALIHLLIILLFGSQVLFNKIVEPPDFTASGTEDVSTDTAPAPPPPAPDSALPPSPTLAAPAPPATAASLASLSSITALSPGTPSFSMPIPAMAPPSIGHQGGLAGTGPAGPNAVPASFTRGPQAALPGVMAARSGSSRGAAAQRFGAKSVSEQAVIRALRWLQSQQHPDGTWGTGQLTPMFTGLGLLCYLGHGETPDHSQEFGVVVTNAINSLLTTAAANRGHLTGRADFRGSVAVYSHAICTYALSEAYTMTKDPRLAPAVTQAVALIVAGQRQDGGWANGYDTSPDPTDAQIAANARLNIKSDTSVSGWQIQALKAASLTGLPGMDRISVVLDNAMKNIDRVFDPKTGTYGYRKVGETSAHPELTGVGVLAKLFWLGRPDRNVREALKNIQTGDINYFDPSCNLYAWYYNTMACFQAQGGAWEWWNRRFQDQLTNSQVADGSWPPTKGRDAGAPRGVDTLAALPTGDGPLYRTVLSTLMLEVYYRYLPTNGGAGAAGIDGL